MVDRGCEHENSVDRFPLDQLRSASLVLFDAVGTLIEPAVPVPQVYAQAAARWGSRRSLQEIAERWPQALQRYNYWGVVPRADGRCAAPWRAPVATNPAWEKARWRRIVSFVIDDVVGPAADSLFNDLWNYFADAAHWKVNPCLSQLWQRLLNDGVPLGIVSNYDERLPAICRRLKPLDQARYVFVSSEIGFPKPHPQFFSHVERTTKLSDSQIAVIGDDWQCDVVGPSQLGWRTFLWVPDRQQIFPSSADACRK